MNFIFLPDKIKNNIADQKPASVIRGSSSEQGEAYFIAGHDNVSIFERTPLDSDYKKLEISYRSIEKMELCKDKFETFLKIEGAGLKRSLKISQLDEINLVPALELWKNAALAPAISSAPALSELSAPVFMAAIMIFASGLDNKISGAEDFFIKNKFSADAASLEAGIKFYETHDIEELFAAGRRLSGAQSRCVLANLLELAMTDGVFNSAQQNFTRRFSDACGIPDAEYKNICDVLIIKNGLAVLYGD